MTSKGKSRWADSEEDAAREAALKKEKELKRRLKREKEAAARKLQEQEAQAQAKGKGRGTPTAAANDDEERGSDDDGRRPAKRRRVTPEPGSHGAPAGGVEGATKLLRSQGGGFGRSRSVENYDKLNDIEEGAYGWVARAKEIATGKVVALKRLKIEPNDRNGLPVTGLREIQILKDCEHRNIVRLQEVVVGEDTTRIEKCVHPFAAST